MMPPDGVVAAIARQSVISPETHCEPRPLFRLPVPAESFPVSALGDMLGRSVEAIHDRSQAPIAICAQSAIAAASLAVQAHADIVLPTGEQNPVSLYLITIAESGERKSMCDKLASRGITEREQELRADYAQQAASHADEKEAWQKARAEGTGQKARGMKAKREAMKDLGPEPSPPLTPFLTADEPTLEGLFKQFQHGQPTAGLFAGEAGSFLGGHGMTEEAKTRTAAGLTHLWDGKPLRRVRSGENLIQAGRRLSAHLMAQPSIAGMLLNDPMLAGSGGQGLVNRFLPVAPEPAAGTRLFREPKPETEQELASFSDRVRMLLSEPYQLLSGSRNELTPRRLPLGNAARGEWIRFQHEIEQQIGQNGRLKSVRGFGNRLPEHAARLAAVIELFESPHAAEVSALSMSRAIELGRHYAHENLRLTECAEVSAELRLAERTRIWILFEWALPLISLPDFYQYGPNSIRSQEIARKMVTILEHHDWLVREAGGTVVNGRKRREVWRILRKS